MEIARRAFLGGSAALVAAPAIVRFTSIMPVRSIARFEQKAWLGLLVDHGGGASDHLVWDAINLARVRIEIDAILARMPVSSILTASLMDTKGTYSRTFYKDLDVLKETWGVNVSNHTVLLGSYFPPASLDHLRRACCFRPAHSDEPNGKLHATGLDASSASTNA